MNATIYVYRRLSLRRNQRWGWRMVAANGRTIATSGEGYSDQGEARDRAESITRGDYATSTVIES